METVPAKTTARPRLGWRRIAALLAIALLAALAWFWRPLNNRAVAAASFGAHIGCSCRFIEGRKLDECRKDFEPGMRLVSLSEDPDKKSVTAKFPLLARQTAYYREGEGCVLEPWAN